jgi:hypothetical protein
MKTLIDERLRREAARFELRYACPECAHFDAATGRCAEGFPNEGHRVHQIDQDASLEFCKSFELT